MRILQKSQTVDYEKLALVNSHILIIGEGGTGKETLAQYTQLKQKKSETFISSNLAALSSEEQD